MLGEFLQEQAALYASGVMTSRQREQFELVMEFHDELRDFVIGLLEIGAAVSLAARDRSGVGRVPVPELGSSPQSRKFRRSPNRKLS